MNGSLAAQKAYQRVKERLVELTVELDDKEHTSVLLTQLIRKERAESQNRMDAKSSELKAEFEKNREVEKKLLREVSPIP